MVKITKVYTRTGDKGETSLAGGVRVKKNAYRIRAIGTVDELNSFIGWCAQLFTTNAAFVELQSSIKTIQNNLFNLGAQLAVLPEYRRDNTPMVTQAAVEQLEASIDVMNEDLPMLRSFILPGGGELGSRFHIARGVCRRAERELLDLQETGEAFEPITLTYINRLSDWLFVAARFAAKVQGEPELLWES